MDLIDIYRAFHPKLADYTFFSSAYETFSRIDHILGHKSSLRKFKKIETVSRIFSEHNAMGLNLHGSNNVNTEQWFKQKLRYCIEDIL